MTTWHNCTWKISMSPQLTNQQNSKWATPWMAENKKCKKGNCCMTESEKPPQGQWVHNTIAQWRTQQSKWVNNCVTENQPPPKRTKHAQLTPKPTKRVAIVQCKMNHHLWRVVQMTAKTKKGNHCGTECKMKSKGNWLHDAATQQRCLHLEWANNCTSNPGQKSTQCATRWIWTNAHRGSRVSSQKEKTTHWHFWWKTPTSMKMNKQKSTCSFMHEN